MKELKFLFRQVQRMRNIVVILALFVCANIGLGNITITKNNGGQDVFGNGQEGNKWILPVADKAPSHLTVEITVEADMIGNVYGACVDDELSNKLLNSVASSYVEETGKNIMTGKKDICVFGPVNDKNLTSQLKFADKIQASKTVVFAKTELERGKVLVKNMKDRTQSEILISEL